MAAASASETDGDQEYEYYEHFQRRCVRGYQFEPIINASSPIEQHNDDPDSSDYATEESDSDSRSDSTTDTRSGSAQLLATDASDSESQSAAGSDQGQGEVHAPAPTRLENIDDWCLCTKCSVLTLKP